MDGGAGSRRPVRRRTTVEIELRPGTGPDGWPATSPGRRVLRWHHREDGPGTDGAAGDGAQRPPVVLLHGLGMSSRSMVPLMRRIAPQQRVLAPDVPGAGASEHPARPLRTPELVDAVLAWLDRLELSRVVLVGHSWGAQLAVGVALRAPERVAGLVLAGPTRDPGAPSIAGQLLRLLRDVRHETPSILLVAALDYLRSGPRRMVALLRHALRQPQELQVSRVRVPTLVVHGTRDPVSSRRWCQDLAAMLPDGRLVVVPGAPHGLVFSTPDAFWAAVCDFCREPPPPRG